MCFVFSKITPGRNVIIGHLHLYMNEFVRPFLIDKLEKKQLKA